MILYDVPQKMRICFPAAQIGQRIQRQIQISEQFRLILFTAPIKAAQQPGPLDGPISHDHDPVAQRQCEINVVEWQKSRGFTRGHIVLQ